MLLLAAVWPTATEPEVCSDDEPRCVQWARQGECTANDNYMKRVCCESCSGPLLDHNDANAALQAGDGGAARPAAQLRQQVCALARRRLSARAPRRAERLARGTLARVARRGARAASSPPSAR